MGNWMDRFCLSGKTALVTGASAGIGEEICRVFANAGAAIVASGRNGGNLASLKAEIEESGGRCDTIEAELEETSEAERLARTALSRHETIDILVNNAGIALIGPALEYSLEDWERTMAVNLRAPFVLAKEIAPAMVERRAGKIINISSQAGVIALPDHAAYSTSKGGLNSLTKSLMVELAPFNIQVNAICPTVILTAMGKRVWGPEEKAAPMLAGIPQGRFGEPVEVADLALYLASPASDFINGTLMMIEGGFTSV